MIDTEAQQAFAAALFEAERDSVPIKPLTEVHPAADISDAYAIAQRVTALKLAAGRIVKGHKVGLTSAVMRVAAGASKPDYGTLFDDWFVGEDSSIPRAWFDRPSVEIEISFVLKDRLAGPGITIVDVIRATDFILPAIEIVDSRYTARGPGKVVVDSIADAAWCGRIVLGGNPRRLDQLDVRAILRSGAPTWIVRPPSPTVSIAAPAGSMIIWSSHRTSRSADPNGAVLVSRAGLPGSLNIPKRRFAAGRPLT